jgi:hypothetical protein
VYQRKRSEKPQVVQFDELYQKEAEICGVWSKSFVTLGILMATVSASWDHEKFASSLTKELSRRRNTFNVPVFSPRSSGRLFEQFLVFGPTAEHEARLLAAYPAMHVFETPISQFMDYCFPTGPSRENLRTWDKDWILDQFVFQLNYSTGVIYGVCLHVRGTNLAPLPFLNKKVVKRTAIAFCLLTSLPVFSVHFTFLTHLATVAMTKSRASSADSPMPVPWRNVKPLPNLTIQGGFGRDSSFPLFPALPTEVAWYYEQSPALRTSVSLANFSLEFPDDAAIANGSSVMWAALDTLFSLLSPPDILTVAACLLLDGQVLVLGDSLQEISMTVFALTCLIRPFEFAGTVIPVLPSGPSYLQLLNSPSPFLIGCVLTGALREFSFVDTALFVELDKHRVCPMGATFPQFPGFAQLSTGIKSVIATRKNTTGTHPFEFPRRLVDRLGHKVAFNAGVAEQILGIIQSPLSQITSDLLVCFFVTDLSEGDQAVTLFNHELFVATVPPPDIPFFNMLFDSMTFQLYVEKRIHEFAKERGTSISEVPAAVPRPGAHVLQRGRPRTKSINRMPSFSIDGPDSD